MAFRIFSITFLCLSLWIQLYSQELPRAPEPRLFDSYGDNPCDDTIAHLDYLALELMKHPDSKAYIVVYSGRNSPSGRADRRLAFEKGFLIQARGIDESRVNAVYGGSRDELTIEIWILLNGVLPPPPTPSAQLFQDRSVARLYDEGGVDFFRYKGKFLLNPGEICWLSVADLAGYARALKAEPDARGHIILYARPGIGHGIDGLYWTKKGIRKVVELIRSNMVNEHGIDSRRLAIQLSGLRLWSTELWILPQGTAAPKPTTETKHKS